MAISPQRLTIYLYSAHRAVIFAIAQLSCLDRPLRMWVTYGRGRWFARYARRRSQPVAWQHCSGGSIWLADTDAAQFLLQNRLSGVDVCCGVDVWRMVTRDRLIAAAHTISLVCAFHLLQPGELLIYFTFYACVNFQLFTFFPGWWN